MQRAPLRRLRVAAKQVSLVVICRYNPVVVIHHGPAPHEWARYRRTRGMSNVKLRQAIALEAARLMYERVESEYYTAKRKAARRVCRQQVKPEDLPSN